jgi:hypothetical protein
MLSWQGISKTGRHRRIAVWQSEKTLPACRFNELLLKLLDWLVKTDPMTLAQVRFVLHAASRITNENENNASRKGILRFLFLLEKILEIRTIKFILSVLGIRACPLKLRRWEIWQVICVPN